MKILMKPVVEDEVKVEGQNESDDKNLIYAYERDTIRDNSCQKA